MSDKPCTVPNCDRKAERRGLCYGHRSQLRRGVPFTPIRPSLRLVDMMEHRIDGQKVHRLVKAALLLADAETDEDYVRCKKRLICSAITLTWKPPKSRRAAPPAQLSPAQGTEDVTPTASVPSPAMEAA